MPELLSPVEGQFDRLFQPFPGQIPGAACQVMIHLFHPARVILFDERFLDCLGELLWRVPTLGKMPTLEKTHDRRGEGGNDRAAACQVLRNLC